MFSARHSNGSTERPGLALETCVTERGRRRLAVLNDLFDDDLFDRPTDEADDHDRHDAGGSNARIEE